MTLKEDSWHHDLYVFAYSTAKRYKEGRTEPAPKNFCTYWWKLIWAGLMLPFYSIGGFIFRNSSDWDHGKMSSKVFATFGVYVGLLLATLAGTSFMEEIGYSPVTYGLFLGSILVGVTLFAIGLGFLLGFGCGVYWLLDKFDRPLDENNPVSMISEKFRAYKEERCPIINWVK